MLRCIELVLVLAQVTSVLGEIIKFENAVVKQPEFITIPKYASDEVPHWAPGRGRSYIDLSRVQVRQDCDRGKCSSKSNLDILVFEDKTSITSWKEHYPDKQFCCTAAMVAANKCSASEEGSLFVPHSLPDAYKIRTEVTSDKPADLKDSKSVSRLEIKTTGLYILLFAVCDANSSPVVLDGRIDSLDPSDEFGFIPFYGSLAAAHTLISVVWAVVCYMYRKDLMFLQLWISVLLAMGMMETTLYFAYYVDWNENGESSLGLLTFAIVMGVVKRTVSRLLVLIIALGFGVVKPSLGDDLRKVFYLGVSYFCLSLVYSLFNMLPGEQRQAMDDPDFDMLSIVIILLMAVEAVFYLWIFKSLGSLLEALAVRKQAAKFHLYRGFQAALLFSLVFTCSLGVFALISTSYGSPDKIWEDDWLEDGYWELAYFVVFTAIAFFFAPSNNAQRFAYSRAALDEYSADAGVAEVDDPSEEEVDREYGGRLEDGEDPFSGKGALDVKQAVLKKA